MKGDEMSGWEQVAGNKENDPVKLAETGEKQQWSFHGHVFDFECKAAPHKYALIPNGVQLEVSIAETGDGEAPWGRIECCEVAIQAGDGAEVLSDFDRYRARQRGGKGARGLRLRRQECAGARGAGVAGHGRGHRGLTHVADRAAGAGRKGGRRRLSGPH